MSFRRVIYVGSEVYVNNFLLAYQRYCFNGHWLAGTGSVFLVHCVTCGYSEMVDGRCWWVSECVLQLGTAKKNNR